MRGGFLQVKKVVVCSRYKSNTRRRIWSQYERFAGRSVEEEEWVRFITLLLYFKTVFEMDCVLTGLGIIPKIRPTPRERYYDEWNRRRYATLAYAIKMRMRV